MSSSFWVWCIWWERIYIVIYIYDIIKHCSILDWYDIHLMLKLYIYPSCGKENLLVKCGFSIGNPTLFHVSLATSVYTNVRDGLFSNFQCESQDPAKPWKHMFKSYIQKDTQLLKWWSKAVQKLFKSYLKDIQNVFIRSSKAFYTDAFKSYLKAFQKVFKSLLYRCFQNLRNIFKRKSSLTFWKVQKPPQKHFQKRTQVVHPCAFVYR